MANGAPPTTTRSWEQTVREADPDFDRLKLHPKVYFFSSGRTFEDKTDPYSTP